MTKYASTSTITVAGLCLAVGLGLGSAAHAKPVEHAITESNVDWVSAGVAGTGVPGTGTIAVSGVGGNPVTRAYLYWNGIGDPTYFNPDVTLDGSPVTGVAIGSSATNCWGPGDSTAYRADVTSLVTGDGNYLISGLSSGAGGNSSNGASLIVLFDDGDPTNDRDLVFFEGNDADSPDGFPGETLGWHATLPGINYNGGAVGIQFHAADGQDAGDGPVALDTGLAPALVIPDDATLWDGISLPSEGQGRQGHGLWDIHTFDMTSAFPAAPGVVSLAIDGQDSGGDCLALVVALVDLEPGSAPPPPQDISLAPSDSTNCTTDLHTVTALVEDDEQTPIADTIVTFTVISGPNAGFSDSAVTDENGEAEFSYGSVASGTDVIEACFIDAQDVEQCATASNTWEICNLPPDCSQAVPTNSCLWPANHKHHEIGILGVTDPDGDAVSISFTGATSDEPTASAKGAGGSQHAPDVVIDSIALPELAGVRAERSGKQDGRVYVLDFVADDGNGGQCTGTVSVQVPHDRKVKNCNAVDSGQDFDATVTN